MPPVTISNQHKPTKTGPAAPVTQSAARSTRLKHWMTSDDGRRMEDMTRIGMMAEGVSSRGHVKCVRVGWGILQHAAAADADAEEDGLGEL